MKKIFSLALALLTLFCSASAEFAVQFELDTKKEVDLNGDGEIEEIWLQMVGTEEESYLMLVLIGGDSGVNTYTTGIMHHGTGGAMDLDGDGKMEIYLIGDQFSNDYATWCLRYSDEGLKTVPFPRFNRSEMTDETAEYGYGRMVSCENGLLTLEGTQDILGTWQASRTFALTEDGFVFADDGMFVIDNNSILTGNFRLEPVVPINVTFDDGSAGTLKIGSSFVITESDLKKIVHFRTDDGAAGFFEISPNNVDGWGCRIDGRPESECFAFLPYAD